MFFLLPAQTGSSSTTLASRQQPIEWNPSTMCCHHPSNCAKPLAFYWNEINLWAIIAGVKSSLNKTDLTVSPSSPSHLFFNSQINHIHWCRWMNWFCFWYVVALAIYFSFLFLASMIDCRILCRPPPPRRLHHLIQRQSNLSDQEKDKLNTRN